MASTQKYVPEGSSVVILRPGTEPQWYLTKKDIVLAAAPTADTCPVTGAEVVTTTEAGIRVWFRPNMIRTRILIEDGDLEDGALDSQLSMIDYDIPHVAAYSPVAALYRVAVPMTESVWLVRTGDVPYALLAEMMDHGATVDVTRLDPTETRSKTARAIAFLQKKLTEAVANANASIARADAKLARSEEEGIEQAEAEKAYTKQIAVIEKRLTKLRADVAKGVARLGLRDQAWNPVLLNEAARNVRSTMTERVRAYTRATTALANAGTVEATALANAAANSQVPVEVLADAVREAGDEGAADQLQAAFAEDDTFSLDTGDE